jgi:thioredoxin-dependent peroxiredoxin
VRQFTRLCVGVCIMAAVAITGNGASSAGDKGELKVGDKVPAFELTNDQGKLFKSSGVVGKKIVVLYFYPADFTGGCTAQACGFRDNMEALKSKDVEVFGISADTPKTHEMFKKYHKLNFTLLSDEQGDLAKKFGIKVNPGKGKATGIDDAGNKVDVFRGATIMRVTVVIDKKGNIAAIDNISKAGDDAKRVAEVIQKLQTK